MLTGPGLNVVLIAPQIPQNTGSIGRLCLATGSTLHLVDPLGFDISASAVKRAGLDYWEHLDLKRHGSAEQFFASLPPSAPKLFFTKKAGRTHFQARFERGSFIIFGAEQTGLPDWILEKYAADCVRIPMFDSRVRSLNLSNAASIVVYEGIRQLGGAGEVR